MNSAMRWGLVTFMVGITCGTLGHFLSGPAATGAVIMLSFICGAFGGLAVEDKRP